MVYLKGVLKGAELAKKKLEFQPCSGFFFRFFVHIFVSL